MRSTHKNQFSNPGARDDAGSRLHPPPALTGPQGRAADLFKSARVTPRTIREIKRRQKILAEIDKLIASGLSQAASARKLKQSNVTLWRWKQRLVPHVSPGRPPAFELSDVPSTVIARVQRLQITGKGNAKAWRAVAAERICPPDLNEFLRVSRTIPPAFLRASKLIRKTVQMVEGAGFSLIT